jgi:hypothetical protein
MKTKPLALLPVILLVLTGCAKESAFYESDLQSNDSRTRGAVEDVRWGYHGDQLLFVIFQTSIMGESHTEVKIAPITAPKNADVVIPHYDHWIALPDGTRKDLPSSRTMFEYDLGGAFTNRPIDLTLDEFREWVASHPEIYSIDKLEEYVAQQRKQR